MPKIIGSSLADHRVQTRERALGAFAALVEERGYESVSLAQVAERAGVGRTALYNHFSGKEELLLAHIMGVTERYVAHMRESLERAGDDPVAQLRAYVRDMVDLGHVHQISPPPDVRALLSRETAQRIREHARGVEALLAGIIEAGAAAGAWPAQELSDVVPLINACLTTRRRPADDGEREHLITTTQLFVLRALGARETAAAGA